LEEESRSQGKSDNGRQKFFEYRDTTGKMSDPIFNDGPDPDPDDDPARPGVEDELQDLIGRAEERRPEPGEDALDVSWGGKLPPHHPDANVLDDLDL
jgi:hypothetical protein